MRAWSMLNAYDQELHQVSLTPEAESSGVGNSMPSPLSWKGPCLRR